MRIAQKSISETERINKGIHTTSARILQFPSIGSTRDMFCNRAKNLFEFTPQSIEVRKSQKGMRIAMRDLAGKLQYLTDYFSYISPIHFFSDCQYFYAGKDPEFRLYTIVTSNKGEMAVVEVENNIFSPKDILHEEYIGNGIIEYTNLIGGNGGNNPIAWEMSFVNIGSSQKYVVSDFSFERSSEKSVFVKNETIYIVGSSYNAPDSLNNSRLNTRCVLVLSPGSEMPKVLGEKFLGNISPFKDQKGEIIGFEGVFHDPLVNEFKRCKILCNEDRWKNSSV